MQHPIAELGKIVRLEFVDAYADGTVHARLEGERGRRTEVCIDGRKDSPTRHRLFERARHPSKEGAILIELGAIEEGIVVSLMSRWLDSDEASRWFTPAGYEIVRETLLRLGDSA